MKSSPHRCYWWKPIRSKTKHNSEAEKRWKYLKRLDSCHGVQGRKMNQRVFWISWVLLTLRGHCPRWNPKTFWRSDSGELAQRRSSRKILFGCCFFLQIKVIHWFCCSFCDQATAVSWAGPQETVGGHWVFQQICRVPAFQSQTHLHLLLPPPNAECQNEVWDLTAHSNATLYDNMQPALNCCCEVQRWEMMDKLTISPASSVTYSLQSQWGQLFDPVSSTKPS